MSNFTESVALTRAHFVEELAQHDFAHAGVEDLERLLGPDLGGLEYERWLASMAREPVMVGHVTTAARTYAVMVMVGAGFPFEPPSVRVDPTVPRSWHLQPNGTLCLYADDDKGGLPWLEVGEFLALITRWCTEAEAGWPGDFPVLDLDRYIPGAADDSRLLLYESLEGLSWVHFRGDDRTIRLVGAGSRPGGRGQFTSKRLFGYVVSIGEPEMPPTDWDELAGFFPEVKAVLERAISEFRISILLVRYSRAGHQAVLALEVFPNQAGSIGIGTMDAASTSVADLNLRAGVAASYLRGKRVLVVGAGAIGSHLADSLARAGVGYLGIRDHDVVRPGNLVRHITTEKHVGWQKSDAVRDVIESRPFNVTEVKSIPKDLSKPAAAVAAIKFYDLVIDATANGSTTAMLNHAADAAGAHCLSVCLKENGRVARVDVLPPISGDPLPESPDSHDSPVAVGYESGCGDPVSLTPHAAVAEAAALAARLAIGLLTGNLTHPAGVERDYR